MYRLLLQAHAATEHRPDSENDRSKDNGTPENPEGSRKREEEEEMESQPH
jgi:hypothetical protein